jgi:hypothetical protein
MINAFTLMVYDFGKPYCWPSQSEKILSGNTIVNLIENAPPMTAEFTVGSSIDFRAESSSAKLNPSTTDTTPICRFNLPNTAKLAADVSSALVVCWFTHTNTVAAIRPTPAVLGYCYQNTVTNQYSVEYNRTGQKYRLRMNGVLIGDIAFPAEGAVLQIGLEYTNDGTVRAYHNGQLFATAPCGKVLNQPTPASIPMLGYAGGYSPGFDGEILRFWMSKNDTHVQNAARVLRDYNLNLSRFTDS